MVTDPLDGPAAMISTDGGAAPRWAGTGSGTRFELTYRSGEHTLRVSIVTEPAMTVSDPKVLLDRAAHRVASAGRLPDGRFLIVQKTVEEDAPRQINLVMGISADPEKQVPLR